MRSKIVLTSVCLFLKYNKMMFTLIKDATSRPTPCVKTKESGNEEGSQTTIKGRKDDKHKRKMYVHNRFLSHTLSHNAVGMFWIIEPGELLSSHFKRHGNKGWILNVCNPGSRPFHSGSKLHSRLKSPTFGFEYNSKERKVLPKKKKTGVSWICLLQTLISAAQQILLWKERSAEQDWEAVEDASNNVW